MSINETDRIDAIGIEKISGHVILTIIDHLGWQEEYEDHLLLLQEKINTYLRFIESGELLETYPNAKGRKVVINVVGKHPLSDQGREFVEQASSVVAGAGASLRFEMFRAD